MIVKPFTSIEKALRQLIRNAQPTWTVGRDFPASVTDLYVRIRHVGGSSGRLEGDFVIDVETFHANYNTAESAGMALEALLLAYPQVIKVEDRTVVFDYVTQNQGPSEIPWDDDGIHRLLAIYTITARR